MKTKNLVVAIFVLTILAFTILNISYGYWTDRVEITGEATFEFSAPVVKDIEMPAEISGQEFFENSAGSGVQAPYEGRGEIPGDNTIKDVTISNEAEEENEPELEKPLEPQQ
ncbi:hypothetical protein MASR2M70_02410 [Bacillota bacterium]